MKKLEAIICSHHWDAIREILGALGATTTLRRSRTVRGGVTPRGREAAIRPTLGSLRVVDSPALVTAAVARSRRGPGSD